MKKCGSSELKMASRWQGKLENLRHFSSFFHYNCNFLNLKY